METGERLAAYLAGELDPDERRALEAALARDPALRARLAAIRATDEALGALPPVDVPADFSRRLRDTLAAEVDARLGADASEGTVHDLGHSRRRRDGAARWPQLAAAAAVVLVVGGVGVTLVTGDADDRSAQDTAGGAAATAELAPAAPAEGPTVVAAGRRFDADSLRALADDARFDEIVDRRLTGSEAADAAARHESAIAPEGDGAGGDAGIAADDGTDRGEAEVLQAPPADPDFGLRTVGEVSEADLAAVRTCLPGLLEADGAVIPVYAELATFEGTDAIVYGLIGNDPEQERHRRVELWVVDREDCQVLHFAQVDR